MAWHTGFSLNMSDVTGKRNNCYTLVAYGDSRDDPEELSNVYSRVWLNIDAGKRLRGAKRASFAWLYSAMNSTDKELGYFMFLMGEPGEYLEKVVCRGHLILWNEQQFYKDVIHEIHKTANIWPDTEANHYLFITDSQFPQKDECF